MTMRFTLAVTLGLTLAVGGLAAASAAAAPPSSASKKWKAPKATKLTGTAATLKRLNPGAKVVTGKAAEKLGPPPSHDYGSLERSDKPNTRAWSRQRLAQAAEIDPSQIVRLSEVGIGGPPQFWTSGAKVAATFFWPARVESDQMLMTTASSSGALEVDVSRLSTGQAVMLSCELDVARDMKVYGRVWSSAREDGNGKQTTLTQVTVDSRRTSGGEERTEVHVVASQPSDAKLLTFSIRAVDGLRHWVYRPGDCVVSQLDG